jgi:hypothetical protein
VSDAVFRWPAGCMGAPVDREHGLSGVEGAQDERGAAEMVGRADDFCCRPVVLMHELGGVVDVLDGVHGLRLFEDGGGGHSLGGGELRHSLGFDEVVVGGGSGHDDVGGDAGPILADAFQYSFALLGGWCAVGLGGGAQDDDGVEMGLGRVVGRKCGVVADDDQDEDEDQDRDDGEGSGRQLHRPRVAEMSVDRMGCRMS